MALGQKTGGRRKGSRNKRTAVLQAAVSAAAEAGPTPLDHLLAVMRDPNNDPATRLDAAKAAAPYMHPKLASTAHARPNHFPIETRVIIVPAKETLEVPEGPKAGARCDTDGRAM